MAGVALKRLVAKMSDKLPSHSASDVGHVLSPAMLGIVRGKPVLFFMSKLVQPGDPISGNTETPK